MALTLGPCARIAVDGAENTVSRGARGHSLLRAAVDTEIEVVADQVSALSVAHVRKQRELPTEGEFAFGLSVVEIAEGLSSCVVVPVEGVPSGRKVRKLPPSQRRALDALRNAVANNGEPAPDAVHYPAGAIVVSVEHWRDCLYKAGVIDPNAGNPREPFRRIRNGLAEAGAMGEWDGKVWPVQASVG